MPLPDDVIGGPAQLTWSIGQDKKLYAHELQTDGLFPLTEAGAAGGTAGPQGPPGPAGPPGDITAAVAKSGPTTIDTANPPYLTGAPADRITLNPAQVIIATDGADSILAPNQIMLRTFTPTQVFNRLHVDQNSGDLIVTQDVGPNAGKSVNLTAGKWT